MFSFKLAVLSAAAALMGGCMYHPVAGSSGPRPLAPSAPSYVAPALPAPAAPVPANQFSNYSSMR